jgi:hypothetical protein
MNVKTCVTDFCINTHLKRQNNILKRMGGKNTLIKKGHIESCRKVFCNPGCVGTMFESGKHLSDNLRKSMTRRMGKNAPIGLAYLNQTRKNLFKGRNAVLKNNFYEGIPSKKVLNAKQHGALSGCVRQI